MTARIRRWRDASGRGQALVEFALVVPLFVLMTVGLFDGARAIYTYNALSNASREAVREAIVNQTDADIEAEANAILGGLADGTTFIHDKSDCTPVETLCLYRVELRHEFTPILLGDLFRPTLVADSQMPVEAINP